MPHGAPRLQFTRRIAIANRLSLRASQRNSEARALSLAKIEANFRRTKWRV
jgi:hypothetical protein